MDIKDIENWTAREKIIACAFLLEGEGTFYSALTEYGAGRCSIKCQMTDYQPLAILQNILGGNLTGPYKQEVEYWKDFWIWQIGDRQAVVLICKALYNFMSPRRQEQIDDILKWDIENPIRKRKIPEHGTITMYRNYKCRCISCKLAMKTYCANWYKDHKQAA